MEFPLRGMCATLVDLFGSLFGVKLTNVKLSKINWNKEQGCMTKTTKLWQIYYTIICLFTLKRQQPSPNVENCTDAL